MPGKRYISIYTNSSLARTDDDVCVYSKQGVRNLGSPSRAKVHIHPATKTFCAFAKGCAVLPRTGFDHPDDDDHNDRLTGVYDEPQQKKRRAFISIYMKKSLIY